MKRIAFFIVCLTSLATFAQQQDTTELLPVEVRAVRAGSTAPFAKTTIGKTAIQRQNLGQDLPFLLNQTPSVVVHSDAGNGVGYTGIRIRGTDATRINVTLNGIPYNDAESGGTFFCGPAGFCLIGKQYPDSKRCGHLFEWSGRFRCDHQFQYERG